VVARPKKYLAAARSLQALVPPETACATVAAPAHGDLNLRNIVLGPGSVLLDPRPTRRLPVGHDLARLFVHYGALLAPGAGIGGPLPGVDVAGFLGGYDLVRPEDASLAFLSRMRVLIDRADLPADESARSVLQEWRLKGLLRLAEAAFS